MKSVESAPLAEHSTLTSPKKKRTSHLDEPLTAEMLLTFDRYNATTFYLFACTPKFANVAAYPLSPFRSALAKAEVNNAA